MESLKEEEEPKSNWDKATPKQRRNWALFLKRTFREDEMLESDARKIEETADKICSEFYEDEEILLGIDQPLVPKNTFLEEPLKYEAIRQGTNEYKQLKAPHAYWAKYAH